MENLGFIIEEILKISFEFIGGLLVRMRSIEECRNFFHLRELLMFERFLNSNKLIFKCLMGILLNP